MIQYPFDFPGLNDSSDGNMSSFLFPFHHVTLVRLKLPGLF